MYILKRVATSSATNKDQCILGLTMDEALSCALCRFIYSYGLSQLHEYSRGTRDIKWLRNVPKVIQLLRQWFIIELLKQFGERKIVLDSGPTDQSLSSDSATSVKLTFLLQVPSFVRGRGWTTTYLKFLLVLSCASITEAKCKKSQLFEDF